MAELPRSKSSSSRSGSEVDLAVGTEDTEAGQPGSVRKGNGRARDWAPRRFWTEVKIFEMDREDPRAAATFGERGAFPEESSDVENGDTGRRDRLGSFAIALDGKPVSTPGRSTLILPTREFAEAVAEEWDSQEGVVDPASMPATRLANTAIDKVGPATAEVASLVASYADSDLTCYRAEGPEGLVRRQAEAWDPPLEWVAAEFGARLCPSAGLMHVPQDANALERLEAWVGLLDKFPLSALHELVSLTGSLVLGLAAARGWRSADEIWTLSRVDENWQEENWGRDSEAVSQANAKRKDFLAAKRHWDLCQT